MNGCMYVDPPWLPEPVAIRPLGSVRQWYTSSEEDLVLRSVTLTAALALCLGAVTPAPAPADPPRGLVYCDVYDHILVLPFGNDGGLLLTAGDAIKWCHGMGGKFLGIVVPPPERHVPL
jgi:hypothetical protein